MRPLSMEATPGQAGTASAPLLLDAIGAYCSLSEQPLPLENWLLDTNGGSVYREFAPNVPQATLLLCHNCRDAHELPEIGVEDALNAMERTIHGGPPEISIERREIMPYLLLPNRDVTFRLGAESPFSYALEPVEIVLTGEDGEPVERMAGECVIVRARSEAAQATLDHFALNTRFFDAESSRFTMPQPIHLSSYDRRVELRTKVWMLASQLAYRFTEAPPELRNALLAQIRITAVAAGFWSVWVTVFDTVISDREVLARLFASARWPRPPSDRLTGAALLLEVINGTDDSWLT